MGSFIDAAIGFPTAIFSGLLAVVLVYWLLAIVGLVDFESHGLDIDVDVHADAEAGDITTLASYLVALGLNGVPFSIVVSLIVLVSWMLSCLAGMWLLPLVPTLPLNLAAGLAVMATAFALSLIATARLIRPLRGLFVTHAAQANASLVGQSCRVLTGSVSPRAGRAEVQQRGTGINVRVWADEPNGFTRGVAARLVEYDAATGRYRIESIDPIGPRS